MAFNKKVLELIEEKKITKSSLAKAAGLPYTTLDSMLKRDSDTARLESIFKIARFLGVSVEELVFEDGKKNNSFLSDEEQKLLELFAGLDERGRKTVMLILEHEANSATLVSREFSRGRHLPVYDSPSAASLAMPIMSENSNVVYEKNIPDSASFGVRINGDSMEPVLHDGQIVWVRKQEVLSSGDIGIFLLNNESMCKKLFLAEGVCNLISLNNKYPPINVRDTDDLRIIGKVLL